MNILVVHNFYQQPGGEDQVFADEVALLRANGNQVGTFTAHNDAVANLGKAALAKKTLWNDDTYEQIRQRVKAEQIQIVHFHNTFPLISPSAYYGARDGGAKVVQTLHNYRLLCPAATFFRDGHVCEECLGRKVAWPGVVHACYRDSRAASAVTAAMLAYHGAKGTWTDAVSIYLALTQFAREKFIAGGLPAEKIVVKPNFVGPDPRAGTGGGAAAGTDADRYVVFVGRLTQEKGIQTLLAAWNAARQNLRVSLKILGDGPLRAEVEAAAVQDSRIAYLGRKPSGDVYDIIGRAEALIFPSLWFEGLPRTIIESFAKATPVIASNLGSMAELVRPGETGALFEPGNPADLTRIVGELLSNSNALSDLRTGARAEFLRSYTAEQNYPMLMQAYQQAIDAG